MLAYRDNVDFGGEQSGLDLAYLEELDQPLQPERKSNRRGGSAADFFNQAVIASAATHGALRAQLIGHPFEDRAGVVVQTANQT